MKKVIITGANGFIGCNLVQEMLKNNYYVYAIVRDKSLAKQKIKMDSRIYLIECDMNYYEKLLDYPELKNISIILHFAWAGVSDKYSMDYITQLNNVKCACDLQKVATQLGIKRFVFADSIMEYEHLKAFEKGFYQVSMRNTYHVAKMAARNLLQLRAANTNMEFIPIVISNIYGIGENSPRLINTAIRNLLMHKHMRFTSGEQLYDFIYISDAVRAIRMVAEKGENNKLYYIGNEEQRTLKSFLFEMRDTIAPDMELGIGEKELQGVFLDYNEIDTKGIFEDFHFKPQYTFKQGIQLTAQWIAIEEKSEEQV